MKTLKHESREPWLLRRPVSDMMRIYLEIGRSMGIYCISTRGASSAHGAANGGSYHGDDLSIPSNVSPEASWVAEKLRSVSPKS